MTRSIIFNHCSILQAKRNTLYGFYSTRKNRAVRVREVEKMDNPLAIVYWRSMIIDVFKDLFWTKFMDVSFKTFSSATPLSCGWQIQLVKSIHVPLFVCFQCFCLFSYKVFWVAVPMCKLEIFWFPTPLISINFARLSKSYYNKFHFSLAVSTLVIHSSALLPLCHPSNKQSKNVL